MKKCRVLSNTHSPGIGEMNDMVGGEYEVVEQDFHTVRVLNEQGARYWFKLEDVEFIDENLQEDSDEPSKEEQEHYEEMAGSIWEAQAAKEDFLKEVDVSEEGIQIKKPPIHATEFLNRAIELFHERGKDYDVEEERSMGKAVKAFNAITGRDLTEPEGWLLLQVLKDVRQWTSPQFHRDSAEDCISYAALKAEALANDS